MIAAPAAQRSSRLFSDGMAGGPSTWAKTCEMRTGSPSGCRFPVGPRPSFDLPVRVLRPAAGSPSVPFRSPRPPHQLLLHEHHLAGGEILVEHDPGADAGVGAGLHPGHQDRVDAGAA